MRKILLLLWIPVLSIFSGCEALQEASKNFPLEPTEAEMTSALKQALEVGTGRAADFLNKPGGYLVNARFKIPFPPDAMRVATTLRDLGFGNLVDKFIERMNRGAEDAAKEAKPIFINAVKQMTIADARNIVLGADNSATLYFQGKTQTALYNAFSPKLKNALDQFEATRYWTEITTTYNKIPLVKPVETDLVKYATNKALDGLFLKLSEEEKDIRNNFAARSTSLLKKVFGWAETQKN